MMTSLFSSFDPTTFMFSLNWMSMLIIFFIIPYSYWFIPSRMNLLWTKIFMLIHKELKILMKGKTYKGATLMFITLLIFIMVNNFMGLFPYIFTSTSHMSITLSMALPLWLSFMIYGWYKNTLIMFAHLVPQGTPNLLMPFMVCIETISNIIRPGTLAIRLSANMIAGHLLMTLMGNTGSMLSIMLVNILIMAQILLVILEMAVSLIQSYVFTVLSTLYSSEVN